MRLGQWVATHAYSPSWYRHWWRYRGAQYFGWTAVYAYPLDKFTFDILHDISGLTITNEEINNLPTKFAIEQNYPNPFNPITKIKFALPQNETVLIEVYNTLGQKVINLLNKGMKVGYHEIDFNGQNLASGIYYYRLQENNFIQTKKMVIMK